MHNGRPTFGFEADRGLSEIKRPAAPISLPSVSVIIPAHNAVDTIIACVMSAEETVYAGLREIIVVDDASTDNTADVASALPCRVIRRTSNGGPATSRNDGAAASSGDILLFVDSDTQMLPDTIEQAVRVMVDESVGAVTGIYEVEPINEGFCARYYAYFKYQGLTGEGINRLSAFGAHCGAVRRELFYAAGGYKDIPWGMDIENEEFGARLRNYTEIAISPRVRVRHHFPNFSKLLYIFTSRVYWFVLFRHFSKQKETVLVTDRLGLATTACPAWCLTLILTAWLPMDVLAIAIGILSVILLAMFVKGYAGFWQLCFKRRSPAFGIAACLASVAFSFVATASVLAGVVGIAWHRITREPPAFTESFSKAVPC